MLGYDFEGMNFVERLINVSPEYHEEARKLKNSNMLIGWPLKAMPMSVFTVLYPTDVYLLIKLYRKIKRIRPY